MSAETYVYDESTGSTILSKIKTNTDFLHLPSKDVKSRDWEKERKKLISYDLHCATLGEYHRQARIPRGLRCNLRPTLFSDNEKYCTTFQKNSKQMFLRHNIIDHRISTRGNKEYGREN
ncbi:unnamed protein product [Ranitomeya imitator]|uniref:Uncharacterized protein n=1 Tax=Ranitomeya imitator TaxID=111125 RepID=A0ABN9LAY5_9NEOB|nr:unnamed protein product [Ranitomeya imitator]